MTQGAWWVLLALLWVCGQVEMLMAEDAPLDPSPDKPLDKPLDEPLERPLNPALATNPSGEPSGAQPATQNLPLRIITWNILHGKDQGPRANSWPARQQALTAILRQEAPDLLCLQEALADQVATLSKILPGHAVEWVGRDDGAQKGESCAIFYDHTRFRKEAGGTFWLSDTPERPSKTWGNPHLRICTWLHLTDTDWGRSFMVANTHFPLVLDQQQKSANLLAERLPLFAKGLPWLLVGDFNCVAGSPPDQTLRQARLVDPLCKVQEGQALRPPTYHLAGIGTVGIDTIYHCPQWQCSEHKILNQKVDGRFPSDHFGVKALLQIRPPAPEAVPPTPIQGGQAEQSRQPGSP